MKILMVCLGNICRSPLAEGILQEKVNKEGLDWRIDSAAMGPWHVGNPPDHRAQTVAKIHNININNQKARLFNVNDFNDFDLILAMDQNNYNDILRMAQNDEQKEKVSRILDVAKNSECNVPDPYYDDNGFEHVYQLLDEACEQLITKFKS